MSITSEEIYFEQFVEAMEQAQERAENQLDEIIHKYGFESEQAITIGNLIDLGQYDEIDKLMNEWL